MQNEIEYSTLFVELDVILDTRIATVAKFGDIALQEVLLNNYYDRWSDGFININKEEYQQLYNNRNKSILKDAIRTKIADIMHEFCVKTLKRVATSPFHLKPKIVVNTYPYDLDEIETKDIIQTVISMIKGLGDIEIINKSYNEITVEYVKNNIAIMILYEYYLWIEAKAEEFKKMTCPEVTLIAPGIYFKEHLGVPNPEAFKDAETLFGPLIGLKLIPIKHFCFRLGKFSE